MVDEKFDVHSVWFGVRLERSLGGKAPLELIVERDWYGTYGNVLYALHSW
jgi:hypothetical protein